jgi:hypothetical protein
MTTALTASTGHRVDLHQQLQRDDADQTGEHEPGAQDRPVADECPDHGNQPGDRAGAEQQRASASSSE